MEMTSLMKKAALFKFQPFSKKQRMVLNWWCDCSPVKEKNGIVADGSIRSGKTLSMSLSYVLWAMQNFDSHNFGMAGKTIGSFRRNVLFTLKLMLKSRGFSVKEYRADNYILVTNRKTKIYNYFYIFGGKDERSQDLIQGITLAGMFFDEVALMPESFVNQAVGRCSITGSKFWFNCNPDNPHHWFKTNWIDKACEKNILYLHFTMDDNLSLAKDIKIRYSNMFSGVFFRRYILGLWVAAEGIIYKLFVDDPKKYQISIDKTLNENYQAINIGIDFGGNKSGHTFVATGILSDFKGIDALASERHLDKDIDYNKLESLFIEFVIKILTRYGNISCIYCDSAEQTLIRGLKKALEKNNLNIKLRDALKCEINERIRATNRLITQNRFRYTDDCESLELALSSALWNPKEKTKDVRLDDGTTDIDTLDGFEYSFERSINKLIKYE